MGDRSREYVRGSLVSGKKNYAREGKNIWTTVTRGGGGGGGGGGWGGVESYSPLRILAGSEWD